MMRRNLSKIGPKMNGKAFCKSCEDNLGFFSDGDGQLVAAEKLGYRGQVGCVVWKRFTEAPTRYPNIPDILSRQDLRNLMISWQ